MVIKQGKTINYHLSSVTKHFRKKYVTLLSIMPLQYLTGFRVLDVMKTGSSRPIIVEDKKGDKYLVKLREK